MYSVSLMKLLISFGCPGNFLVVRISFTTLSYPAELRFCEHITRGILGGLGNSNMAESLIHGIQVM